MITTYMDYENAKKAFIKKHGKGDWKVETSPMDGYGVYHKEYIFSDNAIWYERMAPVWFKQEVEVGNTKVKVQTEFKMFETEYWNTDNAESNRYYEKF